MSRPRERPVSHDFDAAVIQAVGLLGHLQTPAEKIRSELRWILLGRLCTFVTHVGSSFSCNEVGATCCGLEDRSEKPIR